MEMKNSHERGFDGDSSVGDCRIQVEPIVGKSLMTDLCSLISAARQRVAVSLNAEAVLLNWQVGRRIRIDILKNRRAEYGAHVQQRVALKLTEKYGSGWGLRKIQHCVRSADVFSANQIVSAVRSQLGWTHLKLIMAEDDELKRDFYLTLCSHEHWSTRTLETKIDGMLYERTAIANKPGALIKKELAASRELELGTNPFLADTDADDLDDGVELREGTDPTNRLSHSTRVIVFATNTEWSTTTFHTNYFGIGTSTSAWNVVDAVPFDAFLYSTNILSDAAGRSVQAFTDINGNGIFDADEDILLSVPVASSAASATVMVRLVLGDLDGDHVGDSRERANGTDPYDARNFRVVSRIEYTDLDVASGVSNYFAVADAEDQFVFSAARSFADMFCTVPVDHVTTSGVVCVGCLRDLDGDGAYTPNVDVLHACRLTGVNDVEDPIVIEMGDFDRDGVRDGEEHSEGTDACNAMSLCCSMKVTLRGVFTTSNGLTCVASWDGAAVGGPMAATNSVMTFDFGHRASTNRVPAAIIFWDDVNSNGVLEAEESSVRMTFAIQGHDTTVTNAMQLGAFDGDGDGILDYWEQMYGVDHAAAADALRDDDGDGFINLHEYWAGTSPTNAAENGTGTVLRAAMDGVDSRISEDGREAAYYAGYSNLCLSHETPAASDFVANTNCWMADVDLSCLSVWGSRWDKAHGRFWTLPVTVLSPYHVLASSHAGPTNNAVVIFRSARGVLYERHVVAVRKIFGVADGDFTVGILDSPLPESIRPVRMLPVDYGTYIGEGRRLPLVRIGRDKTCNIHDIIFLSPDQTRARMSKVEYSLLGRRRNYLRAAWALDSGHPNFLIVDGEIVFLYPTRGFYYSESQATGFLCVPFYNRIQGAMDVLSQQRNEPRCTLCFCDFRRFIPLLHPGVSQ